MRRLTITFTATVVLALAPGLAVAQDLRSPDARDSARIVTGSSTPGVLQGRDVGSPFGAAERNLSSPDAQDAARRPVTTYAPGRPIRPTQPTTHADSGFHWSDAGVGAAGMLGLVAIVAGTLMVATQRRRHRGVPITTS